MKVRDVDVKEAKRIAKSFGVKLPRVGYEMSLGDRRWLRSNGHAQFGFFDKPADTKPFCVMCRCDETLRPNEPRGCTTTCPNAGL